MSASPYSPPIYVEGMDHAKFLRKFEKYQCNYMKAKYELLLEIINAVLGLKNELKIDSLIKVKNIKSTELIKDNYDLIEEYKERITNILEFEPINDKENQKYILYIIKKGLSKIGGYSLNTITKNKIKYYTINKK